MNKRELIKEYEGARSAMVTVNSVLEDLKQLDEPQKPVVPQFVADWIKYCKNTLLSLTRALMVNEIDFYNYANQEDHSRLITFLESEINQRIFARAWLDGYTVEKEKRYIVKMKGVVSGSAYLKQDAKDNYWYFGTDSEKRSIVIKHTKKELKNSGFGWVFDCPGIEIEVLE